MSDLHLFTIRLMTLDDLPAVVAIDRSSFSLPWPENSYHFELTENTVSRCWVAERDQVVVGIMVVWLIEDEAHIATIATHPDYRRQGVARQLLATALQDAQQRGVLSATLEVREHNQPAIDLYQQFRFQVVGRRKRYYADTNEDALIMTVDGLSDLKA